MKIDTAIPVVGDPIARAAERLLERKRIGLESAIEALETVGYAVAVNPEGATRSRRQLTKAQPWRRPPKRRGPKRFSETTPTCSRPPISPRLLV